MRACLPKRPVYPPSLKKINALFPLWRRPILNTLFHTRRLRILHPNPPRRHLALLANVQRDSAVGTVPLRPTRWDLRQADAFEVEPFLFAVLQTQKS